MFEFAVLLLRLGLPPLPDEEKKARKPEEEKACKPEELEARKSEEEEARAVAAGGSGGGEGWGGEGEGSGGWEGEERGRSDERSRCNGEEEMEEWQAIVMLDQDQAPGSVGFGVRIPGFGFRGFFVLNWRFGVSIRGLGVWGNGLRAIGFGWGFSVFLSPPTVAAVPALANGFRV